MINNIEKAYCMACLENAIRGEYASAHIYASDHMYADRIPSTDKVYIHMLTRASSMISAFEIAFGVDYF